MLFFIFTLSAVPALGLEPPTRAQIEKYKKDGTLSQRIAEAKALGNHKVRRAVAARLHYNLKRLTLEKQGIPEEEIRKVLTPPPGWEGMPTKGTVKVLALLIAFSDYGPIAADTNASITAKLFGDGSGGTPYESLRNYYRRASYNQLEIQGTALGWYTTDYARSSVAQTTAGRQSLIKEALSFYNPTHDFSQYDNDGDGYIDYFVVIWTGPRGSWASFWWGYQTSFSDYSYVLDGKRLGTYSWQWESSSYPSGGFTPSVVIHETGHALGIPDYYDYDESVGPDGGVGGLDMMDSNWGDHNSFSKFLVDWITPQTKSGGTSPGISLGASGTTTDALLFMPGAVAGEEFGEFFMVQNRYRTGNDTGYPTNGLLVWHVDSRLDGSGWDFLYDNSYAAHKLLRLMEADGLEEIETGDGNADSGDYYTSGKTFGPATSPNSSRYDGVTSGMGISGISAAGATMTFDLFDVGGDGTPPTGAPSTPADEGVSKASTSIVFTWTQGAAADPESGIVGYDLQVGTSPGGNDKYDAAVGGVLSKTIDNCRGGMTYYARVRAMNGAGLTGSWSGNSDGITISLPSLEEAVDNAFLAFSSGGSTTSGGKAEWSGQTATSYSGGDAARSGSIGDYQTTYMETTVSGPGDVSFFWKVSSESNYDFLRFSIDGAEQPGKISGAVDWRQETFSFAGGTHALRWTYTKDASVESGSDCGWVDKVIVSSPSVPWLALSSTRLNFGASPGDQKTSPQSFRVTNSSGGTMTWSVADDASWLVCSPASGTGSGKVAVSANPSGLGTGTYSATITVYSPEASNSPRTVPVSLRVYGASGESGPFGYFDTPVEGSTVSGSIAVTGWALDDVEVTKVEIKRDPDPDDPAGAIGADGRVYIGDANFVKDARPDIEGLYPDSPLQNRAGWGYMMLTYGLPRLGNGTFKLYAYALDGNGHRTEIGTKTIVSDNKSRTRPFGTIDTPDQSATVSGSAYLCFGWALTPPPAEIPRDGSTVWVSIDSVFIGHPVYNQYREDVAAGFPGYLNADGAVGYIYIDTTAYEDGVHTIGWYAVDNQGHDDGFGSRFIEIMNAGSGAAPGKALAAEKAGAGFLAREDPSGRLRTGVLGRREYRIEEMERLVIRFKGAGGKRFIGWGADETKGLPAGSTLDGEKGIFYWAPGPGFLRRHILHFAVTDGTLRSPAVRIVVDIAPKTYIEKTARR